MSTAYIALWVAIFIVALGVLVVAYWLASVLDAVRENQRQIMEIIGYFNQRPPWIKPH